MDVFMALVPSAGVLFLFVVAIRAMMQADRRERAAAARLPVPVAEASAAPTGSGAALSGAVPCEGSGSSGDVGTGLDRSEGAG